MTNRRLAYIVKDQTPIVVPSTETVRTVCRLMWQRRAGSALIVNAKGRLEGIFTGRDAAKVLAKPTDSSALPISKAMTRAPTTIPSDSRAIDALRIMAEGGFRHVPVVDHARIWGVVSRGDFKGMELEALQWCKHGCVSAPDRPLAAIVAGQEPLLLASTDTVRRACSQMLKRNLGSVLAVDRRGHLVGIFTGRDAVRLLGKSTARTKDAGATALSKAMTPKPVTASPSSHAVDALRIMCEGGFRHLPVVENDVIRGIVSRSDFTGCELDRLDEEQHLYECLR